MLPVGTTAGRPPDSVATPPPPADAQDLRAAVLELSTTASLAGAPPASEAEESSLPPTYTSASSGGGEHRLVTLAGGVTTPVESPSGHTIAHAEGSRRTESDVAASHFDIAPRADATSFQVGYLGLEELGFQAWVKGDVLAKLDVAQEEAAEYERCSIALIAHEFVERDSQESLVELFSSRQVLWERATPSSSTTAAQAPQSQQLPTTMAFSFSLTPDLPHCIHLPHSGLLYRLEAKLHSADLSRWADVVKSVPIHLTRYSPPGPIDGRLQTALAGAAPADDGNPSSTSSSVHQTYSLQPHLWNLASPTPIQIRLARSLYKRAEPIELCFYIPSPNSATSREKSLRLRSVEADFVRIITTKQTWQEGRNGAAKASKDDLHSLTKSGADVADSAASPAPGLNGSSPAHATLDDRGMQHEALLAHSGKLCRFHSRRAVFMRLTLHPPFDRSNMPHPHPDHDTASSAGPVYGRGGGGGCESVSQETLLHDVAFEVRVRIGVTGGQGEARDVRCARTVLILPGAAGGLERDVTSDAAAGPEGGSSTLASQAPDPAGSHSVEKRRADSSAEDTAVPSSHSTETFVNWDLEPEYDGYEDVGRSLDQAYDDDDAGPSTVSRSSSPNASSPALGAEHDGPPFAMRSLDAHDPPPTLLESQHDLQVEVEVEGVGMAMPRYTSDDLATSNGAGGTHRPSAEQEDDPPPSIWAPDATQYTHISSDAVSDRAGACEGLPVLSAALTEASLAGPPTQSGTRDTSDQDRVSMRDLPPPHSPPRPAYFTLTSDRVNEPPPYAHASLSRAPASTSSPPRTRAHRALPATALGQLQNVGRDSVGDLEGHPPAYAHEEGEEVRRAEALGVVQGRPPGYEA